MDDNIIANLATKTPANLAAADGVVYSGDTRCSSLRTSQFYFLEIKRLQPSRRIFVHGFCSLFLKPEVEGCHSVFIQSVEFIFCHVLTSDKLEPF